MQTIKSGRDYTGHAIYKHSKCGAATLIDMKAVGNVHTMSTEEIVAVNGSVKLGARNWSKTSEQRHSTDVYTACNGCGAAICVAVFQPIYGRFVAEVICNGKCMNATRESCDCSCGGMNHGKGHGHAKGEA